VDMAGVDGVSAIAMLSAELTQLTQALVHWGGSSQVGAG
jgi:hypothetical protein